VKSKLIGILFSAWGEDRSAAMPALIFMLVTLLHLAVFIELTQPTSLSTPAQPFRMEVSMYTQPAPKAPPGTASPTEPLTSKPIEKTEPPRKKPAADPAVKKSAPKPRAAQAGAPPGSGQIRKPYVESDFQAGDKLNPIPDYPEMAIFLGYQGLVTLNVEVSPQGMSRRVTVAAGSGHKILDEAALEAVKKWRFAPSKHGDKAGADSIKIRINYILSPRGYSD